MLDLDRFTCLSFDCYGTLVDWEAGILAALRPLLERHGVELDDAELLRLYAELEARQEAGPYRRYRDVLRGVVEGFGAERGFAPRTGELDVLAESLGDWPPFPDTTDALERLHRRYRLAILSNVDDDLFARTAARLGVTFDEVVTAEQVGSYKPSPANFRALIARLGVAPERLLHVAQSLYHDHAPARRLGLATAWINRPSRRPGVGLAPAVAAAPDLELADLASLAAAAGV